jgi:DNA-binding FadR family transcriptional regulator
VSELLDRSDRKSDEIARFVIAQMESGELGVGDRLPSERDLSHQLGVSRPLVREGYRILESLGVVEVRQGSGVYVADRQRYDDLTDPIWDAPVAILDVLAVADAISARIGELAAAEITDDDISTLTSLHARQTISTQRFDLEELADIDYEFHRIIVHATGNPILESFERLSRHVLSRDRVLLLGTAADKSLVEHGQIIHALEARNPRMAGLAMQLHSVRSHAVMRELIERQAVSPRKGA